MSYRLVAAGQPCNVSWIVPWPPVGQVCLVLRSLVLVPQMNDIRGLKVNCSAAGSDEQTHVRRQPRRLGADICHQDMMSFHADRDKQTFHASAVVDLDVLPKVATETVPVKRRYGLLSQHTCYLPRLRHYVLKVLRSRPTRCTLR